MPGQAVKLSGSAVLVTPSSNEAALMAAVKAAPTAVYFDVEDSFRAYAGGIYSGTDCGGTTINHAGELRYLNAGHIHLSVDARHAMSLSMLTPHSQLCLKKVFDEIIRIYLITTVIAVGFYWSGKSSTSYWIVRNSWGADWGEKGYARYALHISKVYCHGRLMNDMHTSKLLDKLS